MSNLRSELTRSNPPYKINTNNRFSYYTTIEFVIDNMRRHIQFKVDTGSPHTIIGIELLAKKGVHIDQRILQNTPSTNLKAATDSDVNIYPYTVKEFQLTDEICFENIQIYLSYEIKYRAVLGMDILSLFDFQYKHEKGNMLGTFWINNYEEHLQKINDILKKKKLDYLDTEQIFLLDESEKKSVNYTQQDLEANFIQNQINQILDK